LPLKPARALPMPLALCGPISLLQVSKMDPLCHLDYVATITS
jgi:hypothetical protein